MKYACTHLCSAYNNNRYQKFHAFISWTYTSTYAYNRLIFIQVSRRSYRAYFYSEIPEGITDKNDTHLFPLIRYPGYYHITMGIPRHVLIKV